MEDVRESPHTLGIVRVLTIKLALCLCMVTLIISVSHPACSLCKCDISLHTAVVLVIRHVRPWWGLQMEYPKPQYVMVMLECSKRLTASVNKNSNDKHRCLCGLLLPVSRFILIYSRAVNKFKYCAMKQELAVLSIMPFIEF